MFVVSYQFIVQFFFFFAREITQTPPRRLRFRDSHHQRLNTTGEPAILYQNGSHKTCYERFALKNETYPVLVKTAVESRDPIDGLVFHDLSVDELGILDEFEGQEYCRELVDVVTTSSKKKERAWTYIFPEESVRKYSHEINFEQIWKLSDFNKPEIVDKFMKDVVSNGVHWG